MTWEAIYTAAVVITLIGVLISQRMGADVAFLCAIAALLLGGVLTPTEAVAGFANPAVLTVAFLYIVAQGLKDTGGMVTVTRRVLGRPKSLREAQSRLLIPVAVLSAFVNNTPIVAMFLPVLSGWAKRNKLNATRLFMPLSFAAMLGGMCTLIGTSTNLVVNELMIEHTGDSSQGLAMFTLAGVGVPITIVGLAYMILLGGKLLPLPREQTPISHDPRQYTVWMRIEPHSPLVGQSIEAAGLRHLTGLFLSDIERDDEQLTAVGPEHVLRAGDHLRFVGLIESVVELQQFQGLVPDTNQIHKLDEPRRNRRLTEAVISRSSSLVGRSIRASQFRTKYNAVIIAVHRAGGQVRGKIGDIVLQPGDTLLIEAQHKFAQQHRNSGEFHLVSALDIAPAPTWKLGWVALGILAALVVSVTAGWLDTMTAALAAAVLMILTRCCSGTNARNGIDWQVLIVIGTAFGLATAMENSGLASLIANMAFGWSATMGLPAMLAAVYVVTSVFTSVMTNNAAAALVFPIAYQLALENDLDMLPFAVVIAVGASAAFATPVGYQTNLMVMGPGGYTWGDFLRFGGPLMIISGVIAVLVASTLYA